MLVHTQYNDQMSPFGYNAKGFPLEMSFSSEELLPETSMFVQLGKRTTK